MRSNIPNSPFVKFVMASQKCVSLRQMRRFLYFGARKRQPNRTQLGDLLDDLLPDRVRRFVVSFSSSLRFMDLIVSSGRLCNLAGRFVGFWEAALA